MSLQVLTKPKRNSAPHPSCLGIAADRLARVAATTDLSLDPDLHQLVEELLRAASSVEQELSEQRQRIRDLESLSMTDELTGLLNRRGFRIELDRALSRADRRGESGLLLLCDLDFFKAINDGYGHPAGDAVLRAVARLLQARTRQSDAVSRLGGDEFALLITDSPLKQAKSFAKKLGSLVNDLTVPWHGLSIPIFASLGVAPYHGASKADSLLFLADQDLYRSKRQRVVEIVRPGQPEPHPTLP